MSTPAEEPAVGTQAYCLTCNTFFRNRKGAMEHILSTYEHKVLYVDALDPKSREAALSHGLPASELKKIQDLQYAATKNS